MSISPSTPVPVKQNDLNKGWYMKIQENAAIVSGLSSADKLIKHRIMLPSTGVVWANDRDITSRAKFDTATATLYLPLYSGRTLPGASTAAANITNGKGLFTTPARGGDCYKQRVYMSKAGVASPLYLVAEGDDGFAAAGVILGTGDYDYLPFPQDFLTLADANLFETVPTNDESETDGHVSFGTPATPTWVDEPGGAAGTITNGTHVVALVNVARWDTIDAVAQDHAIKVYDRTTGKPDSWPDNAWVRVEIVKES